MIVADASLVTDALVGGDEGASQARERLRSAGEAHTPHLLDVEVVSAIRGLWLAGWLDEVDAAAAVDDLADLTLVRYAHGALVGRAWALRRNLSPYDALYVALAESLGLTLVTCDGSAARAPGLRCTVEVVSASA